MSRFNHLVSDLKIDPNEAKPYRIAELATKPTVMLKPMTEDNKPYLKAALVLADRRGRTTRAKGLDMEQIMADQRKQDILLMAKYSMVGWEGVVDEAGEPVEFDSKAGKELLDAMPHWVADKMIAWAKRPSNFVAGGGESAEDVLDDIGDMTLDDLDDLDALKDESSLGKSSGK